MNEDSRLFTPTVNFLSDQNKDKIHQAALKILSQIGMKILHPQARELLAAAGCSLENDHIVKIPSQRVIQALESTPKNIAVYDRESNLCMDVGGRRAYFGTGSDLIFSHHAIKNERNPCNLGDVRRAARVADALPNIDFVMPMGMTAGVDPASRGMNPKLTDRYDFAAMLRNTIKPLMCSCWTVEGLSNISSTSGAE